MTFQRPELVLAGYGKPASRQLPMGPDETRSKLLLLNPATHDFGVMARGAQMSHVFKVQNIGTAPLTLKLLDTTCKCTVGEIDRDEIPYGETVDITLTWKANSYEPDFRQSATIETNDPDQRDIILAVQGKVQQLVRPEPYKVTLSGISRNESRDFLIKVYSYRDEDLSITEHRFLDPETADFFHVSIRSLEEDEIDDREAVAGLGVQVDVEPGLPLGEVKQTLLLDTNKPDIATLEIAIAATVVSDISVLGGRNFKKDSNILVLGPVPKQSGTQVTLHLVAKGSCRDVEFKVAETDPPEILHAKLGEPREIKDGAVRMFPLEITIPPDSPSVVRVGSNRGPLGKIILETTHPDLKEIEIKVSFIIEN